MVNGKPGSIPIFDQDRNVFSRINIKIRLYHLYKSNEIAANKVEKTKIVILPIFLSIF